MENEVPAVLGIAKKGPMARYSIVKYDVANLGSTFMLISFLYPPFTIVPRTKVIIAMPTPDNTKPSIAE